MRYLDTGFRAVYKKFAVFPLDAANSKAVKDFPGFENSNSILTYGYYDEDEGMILEAIACGIKRGDLFNFYDSNFEIRSAIKMESMAEYEFFVLDDPKKELALRFEKKLSELGSYDAGEEIEETRKMNFLDPSRDMFRIDEVTVYLLKDGLKSEGVQVKIDGLGESFITGKLLKEPSENFGVHQGDKVAFFVQQVNGGRIICTSNLNSSKKFKKEDLEDGKLLEEAISEFQKNKNEDTYIDVLEILRDSDIWMPCDVKYENGNMSIMPEVFGSKKGAYLLAFSSEEKMGVHGQKYAKVKKSMLECIDMASSMTSVSKEESIKGIVINLSKDKGERFVLESDRFNVLKEMKSNI